MPRPFAVNCRACHVPAGTPCVDTASGLRLANPHNRRIRDQDEHEARLALAPAAPPRLPSFADLVASGPVDSWDRPAPHGDFVHVDWIGDEGVTRPLLLSREQAEHLRQELDTVLRARVGRMVS